MKPIKIILNPIAGRGFSAKAEPDIRNYLTQEKLEFDLVHTEKVWHAAELAEQAVKSGFEIVVAVGGDGTTNEVINGLMAATQQGYKGTLGLIPTGSGSDFMFNVGVPSDVQQACHTLALHKTRKVDLIKFVMPGQKPRYFDNQLGIGFDGIVTVEAKKFKRLRGMALYLPIVFKTVFLTNGAMKTNIQYDDQQVDLSTCQISIANAAREGGGFFMTPNAQVDDGYLDLLFVRDVSKMEMMKLIPHFMKGTHVDMEPSTVVRAKKVTITSEDNLIAHYDGELLCTEGHKIECEIVPQCLDVIC